jgi:7-carboxy-7-deazaguanine synthase
LSEISQKLERLRINEIFHSLQGEADAVGFPTVFVRLTGCPLRCQYCDTEYAFHVGDWHDIESIVERVRSFGTKHVCVTGGEPLAQPNCLKLLSRLCDAGFAVSLETSGALSIAAVDPRVTRVVDVKTPGSREVGRNLTDNFQWLNSPSYKEVSPTSLAEWILAERLPVRFQLQLHKILWGDVPGK